MLLATHYHSQSKEFASHSRVIMQHMACAFKSKSDTHSMHDQELVFLYQLASGPCPQSYGMNLKLHLYQARIQDCNSLDEDALDALICLWYELKTSFISGK